MSKWSNLKTGFQFSGRVDVEELKFGIKYDFKMKI